VFSATYTYGLRGNRTSMVVTGTESYTTTYTYDLNNRLLQEDKTVSGTTTRTVYGYDDNGNMTGTVVGTLVNGEIPPGTGVETAYTYDTFNRLVAVGSNITYTYRPDGLRLTKTVDSVTTTHIWDGANSLIFLRGARCLSRAKHCGLNIRCGEKKRNLLPFVSRKAEWTFRAQSESIDAFQSRTTF